MDDPLSFIPDANLGILFGMSAALAALCSALFPALRTPQSPAGILSLQLAPSPSKVRAIVGAWDRDGQMSAAWRSLWLDLPFIALYVLALASLASLVGAATAAGGLLPAAHGETVAAVGVLLSLVTGVLDLIENAGLVMALRGHSAQPVPLITAAAATAKMLLLLALPLGALDLLIASAIGGPN
jgi:hypothetical protein